MTLEKVCPDIDVRFVEACKAEALERIRDLLEDVDVFGDVHAVPCRDLEVANRIKQCGLWGEAEDLAQELAEADALRRPMPAPATPETIDRRVVRIGRSAALSAWSYLRMDEQVAEIEREHRLAEGAA